MFKKLLFLFIIFALVISCKKATTRPSMSDVGTPPSEEGIPDIPDITPPDSEEDYYIKANDTEDTIKSKIQKYYEKYNMHVALVDDTKENIEANKTIEKLNSIINEDIYYEGVFLDLSKTDMTEIADSSFTKNKNLSSIKLPDTLTTIGNSAFANAEKLTAINFPSVLTEIGNDAFSSCVNLQEVNLQYTQIKNISQQVFDSCSKLTKVVLPDGLLTINERAFNNCENLTAINFPSSLTTIGIESFRACSSLKEVNLKDTKIVILNNYSFGDCSSLIEVVLPDGLLGMENGAFSYCTSLEEISFPGGFLVIENNVFSGCNKLKKVNFNEKIKSIYNYAFDGCTSLSKISLPSSLEKLGDSGRSDIFINCTSLLDVEYLGTDPEAITYFGNIFTASITPQNLYLPNVDEPSDQTIKDKWNNFLGYTWGDKIKYKTPMPNE